MCVHNFLFNLIFFCNRGGEWDSLLFSEAGYISRATRGGPALPLEAKLPRPGM